ncbi:DnaJ homolog subfamily C member 13, partial [Geodia barretti]
CPVVIGERSKQLPLACWTKSVYLAVFLSAAFTFSLCRQLSRHLVGLWVTGNPTANALLHRPLGLMQYLKSNEKVPEEADRMHVRDNLKAVQTLSKRRINKLELTLIHWRTRLRSKPQRDTTAQRPVTLRKRRQQIKTEDNWPLFYYQFNEDHSLSTLIWNYKAT